MGIFANSNKQFIEGMLDRLKLNDGYCPRSLARVPDMKCPCREFREMGEGACHCGLFIKRIDGEKNE